MVNKQRNVTSSVTLSTIGGCFFHGGGGGGGGGGSDKDFFFGEGLTMACTRANLGQFIVRVILQSKVLWIGDVTMMM